MNLARLIVLLCATFLFQTQSFAQDKLDILQVFDQFLLANHAAIKCIKPEPATLASFLVNFQIVNIQAALEIQRKNPNFTNNDTQKFIKARSENQDRKVKEIIRISGCSDYRIQDLLKRFKIQADLKLMDPQSALNKETGSMGASDNSALAASYSQKVIQLLESRQWNKAAREVYHEAVSIYPGLTDTVLNQAKSGFIDDAIENSRNMSPDKKSWLLFRIARDTPTLDESKRVDLLQQAAEAVRGKPIPSKLKADALANVASLLVTLHRIPNAVQLMNEALLAAQTGRGEEQADAYRMLADALEREVTQDIRPLIHFAEESAKLSSDPFHKAFSYAALVSIWYQLGDREKALRWWNDGIAIARTIPSKMRAVAENKFASLALKMGDRTEADRQIAAQNGTFINSLAQEVMLSTAERGNHEQALVEAKNIRDNCASDFSVSGLGLRDLVFLQVRLNNIVAARKTVGMMVGCSPRLTGEAFLALAEAEWKAGQQNESKKSYSNALQNTRMQEGQPLSRFQIFLLVSIGESLARTGRTEEGLTTIKTAINEVEKMPPQNAKDRVEAMLRADSVLRKYSGKLPSPENAIATYRMAHDIPKTGFLSEMNKAEVLSLVGLMLAEQSVSSSPK